MYKKLSLTKKYVCIKTCSLYMKGYRVKVESYSYPIKEAYHIIVGDPSDNTIVPFPVDKFHEHFISMDDIRICKMKKISTIFVNYVR